VVYHWVSAKKLVDLSPTGEPFAPFLVRAWS